MGRPGIGTRIYDVKKITRALADIGITFEKENPVYFLLKNEGISIIVSGLFDHVEGCCKQIGLKPHTVNTSLGIHGNTGLLPEKHALEILTMCGHGMISYKLIKHFVQEIKAEHISAKEAAKKMATNCHCGIFDPDRATRILEKMAAER